MLKGETRTNLWGYSAILCVCVGGGSEDDLRGPIFSFHHVGSVGWTSNVRLGGIDFTLQCHLSGSQEEELGYEYLGERKAEEPLLLTAGKSRDRISLSSHASLCSNYFRILTILTAFSFYFFCSPEDMRFPLLDFISSYTSKVRVEVEELLNHSYV